MCLPKFDIHQSAQTIDVLISFEKKLCPMADLKLSHVTSFLPDNLPGLYKNYIQAWLYN